MVVRRVISANHMREFRALDVPEVIRPVAVVVVEEEVEEEPIAEPAALQAPRVCIIGPALLARLARALRARTVMRELETFDVELADELSALLEEYHYDR